MASHFQQFFVNVLNDVEKNERSGPYALVLEQFLSAFSYIKYPLYGRVCNLPNLPFTKIDFLGKEKSEFTLKVDNNRPHVSGSEVDNARNDERNKTAERLWFQRGDKVKDVCDFLKDSFLEHKLIFVVEPHHPGNHLTTSKPAS